MLLAFSDFVGSSGCCSTLVALAWNYRVDLLSLWFPFRVPFSFYSMVFLPRFLQLSAMDVSVRTTMKGAAKCDKHCELQNSVNRQELERILCFWDIPESMPASVSMLCCSSGSAIFGLLLRVFVFQDVRFLLKHLIDRVFVRPPVF